MCIWESQFHLFIFLLLILGFFQILLFPMQLIHSPIKFSGFRENQVAGNKLAILSWKGFYYRELDASGIAERFKEAVSVLDLQKGLPGQQGTGPPRVLESLSHWEGGALWEAILELLSQEHPVNCDGRTWELPLPPLLVQCHISTKSNQGTSHSCFVILQRSNFPDLICFWCYCTEQRSPEWSPACLPYPEQRTSTLPTVTYSSSP